jgi:hypothetical protein
MQKGGGLVILPISGGYTLIRGIKLEPTEGQEPYPKALNSKHVILLKSITMLFGDRRTLTGRNSYRRT